MWLLALTVAIVATAAASLAQVREFVPVTGATLENPGPNDWLMYSRTYDAQRFSPLTQITRQNVAQLREVFKRDMGNGSQESIPIVYRGVMYLVAPGASGLAPDATHGELIWEHHPPGRLARGRQVPRGPRGGGGARPLPYLGARRAHRAGALAVLHRAAGGGAGRRDLGRAAAGAAPGVALGARGRGRPGASPDYLGHRQSDAQLACG